MISGQLIDSVGHQVLQGALIRALEMPDSTVRGYVFSRKDASFEIDHLAFGTYLIEISFQGYRTKYLPVRLGAASFNAGDVYLAIAVSSLDSVTVRNPPMILKKDTLEYNAGSYKTDYYDPVKQLLRKLPGVEVDNDGTIRVNGGTVDQVLVDGKPFFNGAPGFAIQNIPAEIINKVQVYDAVDDKSAFSGMNQQVKKKTINLTIKQNRRKGSFGKLVAGGGNKGVYATGVNLNQFNGSRQLSVIGQANNSNGLVFEPVNIPGSTGVQGGQNNAGISRAVAGGINYRDSWSSSNSSYGSYLYNNQHTQQNQEINTQNFLPNDSTTINKASSSGLNENSSHLITYNIEQKLDPSNSLIIRPKLDLQHGTSVMDQTNTLRGGLSSDTLYRAVNHSSNIKDGQSFSGNVLFGHRFADKAKTFSMDLGFLKSSNNNDGFNRTQTIHRSPIVYTSDLNLHSISRFDNLMFFPTLSYVNPLSGNESIGISYKFRYNQSRSDNRVFRYDSGSKAFDLPDSLQTNAFKDRYLTHNVGVNWQVQRARYDINIGGGVQTDLLRGENETASGTLRKQYTSFTPSIALVYRLNTVRSFQLNYTGNPVALSIRQIQPVSTTTDSLYIQEGNTQLKQPYTHLLTFAYNFLQTERQRMLTLMLNSSITANDIQSSVTHAGNGAQVSKPINVNGSFTLSGNLSYSQPVSFLRSKLGFITDVRYDQIPNVVDNEKNNTRNGTISQSLSWGAVLGKLDLSLKTTAAYTIVRYSLQQAQNSNYFTLGVNSDLRYVIQNWSFVSNGYYFFNNSLPSGFNQILPLLSVSVGHRLLRSRAVEVKLIVSDLLNQQTGLSRSVTAYSLQDTRSVTRGRYFMISFSYDLRHFKTPRK